MTQHYYVSKPGRVVMVILIIILTIIFSIAVFQVREQLVLREFIWVLLIFSGFIFYFIYSTYGKKIIFDSEGVLYKDFFNTYQIQWRDIKEIGVGVKSHRGMKTVLLYFSVDEINTYSKLKVSLNGRKINERFIRMVYDKSVVEDVYKYTEFKLKGSK